jgi:Domain of unknown function (DUF4136)
MKTVFNFFLAAGVLCVLAGCASESVTVTTDHDPAAHFAAYKTYTLAPPARGETLSPVAETALQDSVRTDLAKLGITEAPGKKADLDVVRHVFVHEKVSVQQYTDWGYGYHGSWPYSYGRYGMWYGAPVTYTDVNTYGEGTLILDFVDAHTKKLVFRGVGKAVVGGPESNAEKIRAAVAKIMDQFPRGG